MTKVLWFTGLSGSGKSTIADLLKKEFDIRKISYEVFDGDDIREKFHKNLGFAPEDIKENNRLITSMCEKSFGKVDYILVPVISPFRESRSDARKRLGKNFIEVYINCSFDECKKKDVKGLYRKAEIGEIKNFIGLHIPYEPPLNPEIEIFSSRENLRESLEKVINYLMI